MKMSKLRRDYPTLRKMKGSRELTLLQRYLTTSVFMRRKK
jgi:hypothetical protein